MTAFPVSGAPHTQLEQNEMRRQMRDALERFEVPSGDLPRPSLSSDGSLAYDLPMPIESAFELLRHVLAKAGKAIAFRDDAAYRLELGAGFTLDLWPKGDTVARLVATAILAEDDVLTGKRFREMAEISALLAREIPDFQAQIAAAVMAKREAKLESQFSAAEQADLAGALALLESGGYEVVIEASSQSRFGVEVSRAGIRLRRFDNLPALLSYATAVAGPATEAQQPQREHKARPSSIVTAHRPRPVLPYLLLITGIALIGLLVFYPWH